MNMENTEFVHESSPNQPNQFSPEKPKTENFLIDDLLNFPTDEMVPAVAENIVSGTSTDSTVVDTCNSPLCGGAEHNSPGDFPRRSFTDTPFSNDLCVPNDDLAEPVEESCEDLQKLEPIPGIETRPKYASHSESDIASSSIKKKIVKAIPKKTKVYDSMSHSGVGRRCMRCGIDKTPQWRTGPLGPKTLCNTCGDRYKVARLVPEYRSAAYPTIFRNILQ